MLYQGLYTPIPSDKSKKKHDFFQGHTVSSLDAFPLNSDASSDICQFFSCILTPRMVSLVSLLCHVLPFMSRAYSMGGIPLSNHRMMCYPETNWCRSASLFQIWPKKTLWPGFFRDTGKPYNYQISNGAKPKLVVLISVQRAAPVLHSWGAAPFQCARRTLRCKPQSWECLDVQ